MGTISMYSNKSAWCGQLQWSYSSGYVTVTMYTWKTDGYPSSATSGASFRATITIGSSSKSFAFQQQETYTMTVGTHSAYVSGKEVYISGQVEAPYGVSMYGNPLTGAETVVLQGEDTPETEDPSEMTLGSDSVAMTEVLNISIFRYNAKCTHTLKYRVKGVTASPVTIESGVGNFYSWQVPDLSELCRESTSIVLELICITRLDGVLCGETSKEITVQLPGATKPVCSTAAAMGSTLAITTEGKLASFTHDLFYTLAEETVSIAQQVQSVFSWNIPLELAKCIPNLTKAAAVITCVTMLGSLEVGRESITLWLTVPDNDQTKPTVRMQLRPSGDLGEVFSGMYIRGRTGVQAEFTAESAYSEIKGFALVVDGVEVTGNPAVSAYLRSHGAVTVTGRVTDARGYSWEVTQVIQVVAYDRPAVIPYPGESAIVAVRCEADGTRNPRGQHLLIRAGRKYTALSTGQGQLNYCSLHYRIKKAGSESYSQYVTLLSGEDLSEDYVQIVVENAVPELKSSYTLQLEAEDTLGGYSAITVPVAALTVPFHIGRGNRRVAVGKYCDYSRSDAFEIGLTTYFDTGIALRKIFSDGEWAQGAQLGSSVADAEISAIGEYTFFLGVCQNEPVWLIRLDQTLFGSGIRIACAGTSVTLETAPAAVTALYAVL